MVREYSDIFVFFRMGDDLGHRTATMLEPDTIRQFILPQHKKVIDIIHAGNKKFLLHSCGNIFEVMPDIIDMGIDAKHSNEDQIAPYDTWIDNYSDKIGLFGGFDMNYLICIPMMKCIRRCWKMEPISVPKLKVTDLVQGIPYLTICRLRASKQW